MERVRRGARYRVSEQTRGTGDGGRARRRPCACRRTDARPARRRYSVFEVHLAGTAHAVRRPAPASCDTAAAVAKAALRAAPRCWLGGMSRKILFVVNHAGFFLSHRSPLALGAAALG